jgi:hypothetical protein
MKRWSCAQHPATVPAFILFIALGACTQNEPAEQRSDMRDNMREIHEDMGEVNMLDRENFEKDRQDILSDLRDLRDDINTDLERTEKDLADNTADEATRSRNERLRKELLQQRTVVERHLEEIEKSSMQTWDHIRSSTRNILEEADLFYKRERLERGPRENPAAGSELDLNRNATRVR